MAESKRTPEKQASEDLNQTSADDNVTVASVLHSVLGRDKVSISQVRHLLVSKLSSIADQCGIPRAGMKKTELIRAIWDSYTAENCTMGTDSDEVRRTRSSQLSHQTMAPAERPLAEMEGMLKIGQDVGLGGIAARASTTAVLSDPTGFAIQSPQPAGLVVPQELVISPGIQATLGKSHLLARHAAGLPDVGVEDAAITRKEFAFAKLNAVGTVEDVDAYTGPGFDIRVRAGVAGGIHESISSASCRQYEKRSNQLLKFGSMAALPPIDARQPLTLPAPVIKLHDRGILPERQVRLQASAVEGVLDVVTVDLNGLPSVFWYSNLIRCSFIIDPCEMDTHYKAGVAVIDKSMREASGAWNKAWIREHTTRAQRAVAVRQFGRPRFTDGKSASELFGTFQDLSTSPSLAGDADDLGHAEEDFERGCSRLVGCISPALFQALLLADKPTRYDITVAFGRENTTPYMLARRSEVEAAFRRLVELHCEAARSSSNIAALRAARKMSEAMMRTGAAHVRSDDGRSCSAGRGAARTGRSSTEPRRPLATGSTTLPLRTTRPLERPERRDRLLPGPTSAAARYAPPPDQLSRYSSHEAPLRGRLPLHETVQARSADSVRAGTTDDYCRPGTRLGPAPQMHQHAREVDEQCTHPQRSDLHTGAYVHGEHARSADHYNTLPDQQQSTHRVTENGRRQVHCRAESGTLHAGLRAQYEHAGHTQQVDTQQVDAYPVGVQHAPAPLATQLVQPGLPAAAAAAGQAQNAPSRNLIDTVAAAVQQIVSGMLQNAGAQQTAGLSHDVSQQISLNVLSQLAEQQRHPPLLLQPAQPLHVQPPQFTAGARHALPQERLDQGFHEPVTMRLADNFPEQRTMERGPLNHSQVMSRCKREWQADSNGREADKDRHGRTVRRRRSLEGPLPQRLRSEERMFAERPVAPSDTTYGDRACTEPTRRPPSREAGRMLDPGARYSGNRAPMSARGGSIIKERTDSHTIAPDARIAAQRPRSSSHNYHSRSTTSRPGPREPLPNPAGGRLTSGDGTCCSGMLRENGGNVSGVRESRNDAPTLHPDRHVRRSSSAGTVPQHGIALSNLGTRANAAPVLKLRSGGSRIAARHRQDPAIPHLKDNEDAFAIDYSCFAVADGSEFVGQGIRGGTISSAAFASELVMSAVKEGTAEVAAYVREQGRGRELLPPIRMLEQAAGLVKAEGCAAALLGVLNPLTGVLSIGKVGNVGYLVLRPPSVKKASEGDQDLEVVTSWRPYMRVDHARNWYATKLCASAGLGRSIPSVNWETEVHTAAMALQPSDIVIAATDGFFDAVHVIGKAGHQTRQEIREAYLEQQLDPGQLAEKLLLRAWRHVQGCRELAPAQINTPLFEEARRRSAAGSFTTMPEDDVAVVVAYVLQA